MKQVTTSPEIAELHDSMLRAGIRGSELTIYADCLVLDGMDIITFTFDAECGWEADSRGYGPSDLGSVESCVEYALDAL